MKFKYEGLFFIYLVDYLLWSLNVFGEIDFVLFFCCVDFFQGCNCECDLVVRILIYVL